MLPKSCSSDHIHKNSTNPLRKTQSSEGSDIFDYLGNETVGRSNSHFSGILTIAPSEKSQKSSSCSIPALQIDFSKNEGLKSRFVAFIKRIIPVMLKSKKAEEREEKYKKKEEEEEKDVEKGEEKKKKKEKKMMDSDVYEIDELNSTIAPSSSRQCIVGADLECVAPKKAKKKPVQRTDFHPKPPFSCWPIYTVILLGLLVVLIVGAVTTLIDMRPELLSGNSSILSNATVVFDEPPVSFSTLKPQ